jgi:hypothetical protein
MRWTFPRNNLEYLLRKMLRNGGRFAPAFGGAEAPPFHLSLVFLG